MHLNNCMYIFSNVQQKCPCLCLNKKINKNLMKCVCACTKLIRVSVCRIKFKFFSVGFTSICKYLDRWRGREKEKIRNPSV